METDKTPKVGGALVETPRLCDFGNAAAASSDTVICDIRIHYGVMVQFHMLAHDIGHRHKTKIAFLRILHSLFCLWKLKTSTSLSNT